MAEISSSIEAAIPLKKRIWGWYFFDWASQPYLTLMLTFIFGPYFAQTATEYFVAGGMDAKAAGAEAQALWGYGLTVTGILIAVLAPTLGAVADSAGRRLPWVWVFSAAYVIGAFGCWYAAPQSFNAPMVLAFFGLGMIGMEFATIFTNSYLPSLGPKDELGRISGAGWGFGYVGGVLALAIMLLLFQAGDNGRTMAGIAPLFGLDPETGEDTRIVGPLTAIWYALFMIPFFLWVKETPAPSEGGPLAGIGGLVKTVKSLPRHPSLLSFLGSSMFYRDALNGVYTFGGIYALGVLGWSIQEVGIFGVIGAVSGAIFTWIGGYADRAFGPKPVIFTMCLLMIATVAMIVSLSPTTVLWFTVEEGSALPTQMFFLAGVLIGAGGGVLQSASRNMLTRQGNPERMTEAFGLYALSGKATTFIAPATIAVTTDITGSQRLGALPLLILFAIGLVLLCWVRADGDDYS